MFYGTFYGTSSYLPSFWYYCHKILMPQVQTARKTLATCPPLDVRVDATTLVLKKHIKKMDHSGQIKTPR